MPTHTIKKSEVIAVHIDNANDEWHVATTGKLTILGDAFVVSDAGTNAQLAIDGQVFADGFAINSIADTVTVDIGIGASVVSTKGISLNGAQSVVHNHGLVTSTGNTGISLTGFGVSILNTGHVVAPVGLSFGSDQAQIVNTRNAVVEGSFEAVQLESFSGETATLVNHGTLSASGGGLSVAGNEGREIVHSDGHIIGTINLAGGADVIDLRRGKFHGQIFSGTGDDTLWTDRQENRLSEFADGNIDTVKSTVTYRLNANVENLTLLGKGITAGVGNRLANLLIGSGGDNTLRGGDGSDVLIGHKGDDKLFGDGGADQFTFSTGDGHDTVEDFHQGLDHLDIANWGSLHTFSDLKSHAHDHGTDVVIESGHDNLIVHGLNKADLTPGDFFFAE
jgi:Ca2+-binding RTX toxin-like protein